MRQSCIVFQTASYMWNVADFNPPHLHLAPPLGVTPVEFRVEFVVRKLESTGDCVALFA